MVIQPRSPPQQTLRNKKAGTESSNTEAPPQPHPPSSHAYEESDAACPPQPESCAGIQVPNSLYSASPWVIRGPAPVSPGSDPTECTKNNIHHLWRPQDQPSQALGQVLCMSK